MPSAFDFGAAAEQAIEGAAGDTGRAVLDRLAAPDSRAALEEIVHDMIVGPIHVNECEAREGIRDRLDSRDQAGLIVSAIANALEGTEPTVTEDGALASQVAALSYKDWTFQLVRLGERRAVRVVARVENAYRPDTAFTTSRTVAIGRSVAEAALQGVLSIEEHEARERLCVDGRRVLSPHIPAQLPATSQ